MVADENEKASQRTIRALRRVLADRAPAVASSASQH
jgi:hypothetical protein